MAYMRTWGRVTDPLTGIKTWVMVTTDADGYNDAVWLTTLCQVLKLNPGESPFYANYGIPAIRSVIEQIFPDYYVIQTQQQFSGYFAALQIAKPPLPYIVDGAATPYYNISVVTNLGSRINAQVPV